MYMEWPVLFERVHLSMIDGVAMSCSSRKVITKNEKKRTVDGFNYFWPKCCPSILLRFFTSL